MIIGDHLPVGGAGHVAGVWPGHEVVGGGGSGAALAEPRLADLLTSCKCVPISLSGHIRHHISAGRISQAGKV